MNIKKIMTLFFSTIFIFYSSTTFSEELFCELSNELYGVFSTIYIGAVEDSKNFEKCEPLFIDIIYIVDNDKSENINQEIVNGIITKYIKSGKYKLKIPAYNESTILNINDTKYTYDYIKKYNGILEIELSKDDTITISDASAYLFCLD